jgi:APA family basic amino acid/polyamine antiporter
MLGAFVVICGAILVLRRARPELKRSFRVPWVPLVPLLGMGFSAWLIYGLPTETYVSFIGWMLLGVAIYFAYGLKHSGLARG